MATEELQLLKCSRFQCFWQQRSSLLLVLVAPQMNKPNWEPVKVVSVTVLGLSLHQSAECCEKSIN